MRCFSCIVLFFLLSCINVFSQGKTISHTVLQGETVAQIARYYNISSSEIYDLNPEARAGIKYNTILLIPSKSEGKSIALVNETKNQSLQTHEVQTKETAYGVAKQYNITVEELYRLNPQVETEGLKIGQIINVPSGNGTVIKKSEKLTEVKAVSTPKVAVVDVATKKTVQTETISYEVLPKESMYSIARDYGITFADLQDANPELEQLALQVGQKIRVPVKQGFIPSVAKTKVVENESSVKKEEIVPSVKQSSNSISSDIKLVEKEPSAKKDSSFNSPVIKEEEIVTSERQNSNSSGIKLVERKPSTSEVSNSSSGMKIVERKPAVDAVVAKEVSEKNEETLYLNKSYNVELANKLISTASENMGTRYRSGGTTSEGFDCSGLMYYTFSTHDIKLPRSSVDMAGYGSRIDTKSAQKGDLIFFKTNGRGQINHVGLVLEVLEGEIKFIHSSTSRGVIVSSTKEAYYESSFAQVNRVL